jgi:hypothetical protein
MDDKTSDGRKTYMLFAVGEVLCVFLPVLVHGLVLMLRAPEPEHAEKTLFDQPDLLYAAIVLPGIATSKWLVGYIGARQGGVHGSAVFARVMCAGVLVLISAIVLGLFFSQPQHGSWWRVIELLLALLGIPVFLLASYDYYGLAHHD